MEHQIECEECGNFAIEADTPEQLRDEIAIHLMLVHKAVEWEEEGNLLSRFVKEEK